MHALVDGGLVVVRRVEASGIGRMVDQPVAVVVAAVVAGDLEGLLGVVEGRSAAGVLRMVRPAVAVVVATVRAGEGADRLAGLGEGELCEGNGDPGAGRRDEHELLG